MKEKIKKELVEKCKDLGLSAKAIDELASIAVNGLDENSTDDDISEKVDSVLPFAKAMQGEVTRKTQRQAKKLTKRAEEDEEGEEDENGGEKIPSWAQAFKKQLDDMKAENEALKAEKKAGERKMIITETAKRLGIPEAFMKRFSIGDDEDVEKTLTEFQQELVNAQLMPKSQVHEIGRTSIEEMTKAEEAFVNSLPSK